MADPSMADPIETQLEAAVDGSRLQPAIIADVIRQGREDIYRAFDTGAGADQLVAHTAALIDSVLRFCFAHYLGNQQTLSCALVAVGGYGRSELLPGSDIDLMILLAKRANREQQQDISEFLTFLWDIGLEVGHSVRTIRDCVSQGKNDVTVMTNMIESRLVDGDAKLYAKFEQAISPRKLWPARKFFEAKLQEQQERHLRFNDTAYNLEPNIKEGPGGLRDIQIIGWVAKRHFDARSFHELVEHGFITEAEYEILDRGQQHLWRVRFALHRLAGRREDRLLFDYQQKLAEEFGFESAEHNLAIEQFMQQYYRTIMELERLNEMLLQIFKEEILLEGKRHRLIAINERFYLRNNYIEAAYPEVFRDHPPALVELFLLISLTKRCEGVTASTIRLVREHLYLIDDAFRSDETVTRLFMRLMSAPRGQTHQMRRMNSYGFLQNYIPAFGKITGRMQYDLFHAYTVDQHTIFVIRNLRRFAIDKHEDEFPFCNLVYRDLENPVLLYLAALFHDIAKGRGGDHSVLGAEEATLFCLQHGMNRKDTRIVSQLVRDHLLMSVTAQRKDISDPDVVRDFARHVGSVAMLDYLYLLTVADIRSTNPKLWNNWKDALLKQLYNATKTVLRRGIEHAPEIDEIIQENRDAALEEMSDLEWDEDRIDTLLDSVPGDYFLRHHPLEIRWHVDTILRHPDEPRLVSIRQSVHTHNTKVFVYGEEIAHAFSQVTGTLGSLGLSILNAEIFTTRDGKIMDTFIIQDVNGEAITDEATIRQIETSLLAALESDQIYQGRYNTRKSRHLKVFDHPTQVQFEQDYLNGRTVMEISALDMPGLLSVIANVIAEMDINITHAKIATLGEKIDDIFYLTTGQGQPITDGATLEQLEQNLVAALEARKAA